jgi:site-specific recombinase XerD
LRHTFASWLVQTGVPLVKVKALLRHGSITTTEKYARLAPQDTRESVEKLAHHTTHSTENVVPLNHAGEKNA